MDRRDSILKYVTKEERGIEIGPWFNPLAPKREGWQCLVLDVFDAATLKRRALDDPNVPDGAAVNIEDVDLVGSSTSIGDLVAGAGKAGAIDYIVSSHNFEHLPDPIRFLQGCAGVLKPGGMLSMAIPDRRACFDYFRPVTRLSEWLQAYIDRRERPSPAQNFDSCELFAHVDDENGSSYAFFRDGAPDRVSAFLDLEQVYAAWKTRHASDDIAYHDAHCSVFTPASFEMLIRDVAYLGLASFEVLEVFDAGCEFHAHLRCTDATDALRPAGYQTMRNALLRRIHDEAAETSRQFQALRAECEAWRAKYGTPDASNARDAELARASACVRQLEDALEGLRSSTSWRATAPIRRGVTMLRALTGIRR
ncbi:MULTISPECIES: class I SAM-dependent methyltransferase [unclassified Caballeronia]|uniref:class I SAM-dependent methyltransferase n=1 Tax=unclassified Caballeronia TaxID=2646786 RepID=UPI0020292ABF|nr:MULTISPECIES: class I SAM-dependent methyltransferase [unclassified Caballeronia]